jgi:similar to spore coat protein
MNAATNMAETSTLAEMPGIFAPHEIMEAHEILVQKTVCATKSATMQILVSDPELKALLQQDVASSRKAIQELQAILSKV